ncbi:MAG: NADH-ubiquinone oxidoreductase-F iron-sulfur binding region domain-containing protein [Candidatus Omnitrophota bacterium]
MSKREGPVVFSGMKPLAGLRKTLEMSGEDVIEVIKSSNLKGRGGAGFPTGMKWGFAASDSDEHKYVVCNADEGEPGTFKDRVLLSEYPSLMLEGMVIAGYAIGADKGYIYLRGEYKSLKPVIEKAIREMKDNKALGEDILGKKGFNFDIQVKMGSGAYVCGEETALIESMEGQRGEPRNRPPFPVNTGFLGFPTIVNNVETMSTVPHILVKGADWFKSIGTEKSAGTKLLSVSGDCAKPGVYEIPFGITVEGVLKMAGADDTKAVQIGGASGACVGKNEFGRKIAFEDLATGGSFIIFNSSRKLLDMVENFLEFFGEESCGQCTPCREGIPVLIEGIEVIKKGECDKRYLKDLFSLCETMQCSSKCGLGQSVPNAFISVMDKFKDEYKLSTKIREETVFNG